MGNQIASKWVDSMYQIPKTIHYCWFGGNPLGEKERTCIESWKKFLPDYEIKRWDESNWDVRCCDYVSEAYDARQWAFVSDYARFDILYRYGGLYFDTDVELIKSINDVLTRGSFMGFETDWDGDSGGTVNPGLGLGAIPGLSLYQTLLVTYQGNHFVNPDGSFDQTTVVTRTTKVLLGRGLERKSGIQQVDGVWIYPSEYFNPKDFQTGEIHLARNTRSIHHFNMSWYSPEQKFEHDVNEWLRHKGVDNKIAHRLAAGLAIVRYLDVSRIANHR